jgi:hypothetical protein
VNFKNRRFDVIDRVDDDGRCHATTKTIQPSLDHFNLALPRCRSCVKRGRPLVLIGLTLTCIDILQKFQKAGEPAHPPTMSRQSPCIGSNWIS